MYRPPFSDEFSGIMVNDAVAQFLGEKSDDKTIDIISMAFISLLEDTVDMYFNNSDHLIFEKIYVDGIYIRRLV